MGNIALECQQLLETTPARDFNIKFELGGIEYTVAMAESRKIEILNIEQ